MGRYQHIILRQQRGRYLRFTFDNSQRRTGDGLRLQRRGQRRRESQ